MAPEARIRASSRAAGLISTTTAGPTPGDRAGTDADARRTELLPCTLRKAAAPMAEATPPRTEESIPPPKQTRAKNRAYTPSAAAKSGVAAPRNRKVHSFSYCVKFRHLIRILRRPHRMEVTEHMNSTPLEDRRARQTAKAPSAPPRSGACSRRPTTSYRSIAR